MKRYIVSNPGKTLKGSITLPASKSESNRLLIMQALSEEPFYIENLADAEDTVTLKALLEKVSRPHEEDYVFDTGAAGTTMRFLTAYFSTLAGTRVLTGTERMKKRPISILVDALRGIGAKIDYIEEEGFPPLKIEGAALRGGEIELEGNVSSQFISALLMIAPLLHNGLVMRFKGEITSRPYINMTIRIMEKLGVYAMWQDDDTSISVSQQPYLPSAEDIITISVEPDWSAASYWYTIAALADEVDFRIEGLQRESLQGDSILAHLFTFFGVNSTFDENGIGVHLAKAPRVPSELFGFDFSDTPDIVQSVAVVSAALKVPSLFKGVHTLKIKETDRVTALIKELSKIGATLTEPGPGLMEAVTFGGAVQSPLVFDTYEDHRMAMSLAPLAIKFGEVTINDPGVVKKSYPGFWDDLKKVGFIIR
ncbi:MAG: 3-phosphoshikimate 1-carboxyvinyltransferase [Bacteroidetes bacterium]|nr:MAG: 3-phosphoshikimate 1-carboxyvinyltransferase [Bacteroidota bacterium]